MTAESTDAAVEYMVRRSIGLLLSDLRSWKRDLRSAHFGISGGGACDQSRKPLLGILMIAFNLWNACREIDPLLAELTALPQGWERGHQVVGGDDIQGTIDWSKTFEHRQGGGEGYVVQSFGRKVQGHQVNYIALLLLELFVHCSVVQDKLLKVLGGASAPTYMLGMLRDIELIHSRIEQLIDDYYILYLPDAGLRKTIIEESLLYIIEKIDDLPEPIFSHYESRVQIKPPTGTYRSDPVMKLRRWRERYLACTTWITGSDVFVYRRTGNASDLYEMWCFFEICAAALRLGLQDVVQLCFIRRGQTDPQFRFGNEAYVYFDYRTSSLKELAQEKPGIRGSVKGVFVEWFILDSRDYERSMCLDVKYATWESREVLKVMGYMLNFGIKNGALVIRDKIRGSTLGGEEILPGLHRVHLRASMGVTLWVVSLMPRPEDEERNLEVLDRFVSLAFS